MFTFLAASVLAICPINSENFCGDKCITKNPYTESFMSFLEGIEQEREYTLYECIELLEKFRLKMISQGYYCPSLKTLVDFFLDEMEKQDIFFSEKEVKKAIKKVKKKFKNKHLYSSFRE